MTRVSEPAELPPRVLAVGVLMCRYRVDRDRARQLLHDMAAESGTGVDEVADGLLGEHERAVVLLAQRAEP